MRRMVKVVTAVMVVAICTAGLASCARLPVGGGTGETVSISGTTQDPDYGLNNSGGGPYPVIEVGVANSCVDTSSQVSGRQHYCRVVDGYEEIGDRRNWLVRYTFDGRPGGGPIAQSGNDDSYYGRTIITDGGEVFEGCDWRSPDNSYLCDYRIRKPVVTNISGGAWSHVLHKAWAWTKYIGNALGCAGGIAGVMIGKPITLPLLTDCVDGPM
jgi:hypothetical protein